MKRVVALSFVMAALLAVSASAAPLMNWSTADDFRAFPNQENPCRDQYGNLGVWSYLYRNGNTRDGNYPLMPYFVQNMGGFAGLNTFQPDAITNPPWAAKNVSGADVVIDSNWTWPADEFEVHPPDGGLVVAAWKSPIDGFVSVDGTVADRNPGGGNGVNWFVDTKPAVGFGYSTLVTGGFGNGGSQLIQDGTKTAGVDLNRIRVSQGDTVYFVVDANGSYGWDATALDAHVHQGSTPLLTWRPFIDMSGMNPQKDTYGNGGVWRYMYKDSEVHDGTGYLDMPYYDENSGDYPQWNCHRGDGTPSIAQNLSGSDLVSGSFLWPAGTMSAHPPDQGLTILSWMSPMPPGIVSISGGLTDLDPGGGNGIQWYIDAVLDGTYTTLASGGFDNGGSQLFAAGMSAPGVDLSSIWVQPGDQFLLVLASNGIHWYDSTGVDFVIDAMFIVPEPTSLSLLALGGLALLRRRGRRLTLHKGG